MNICGVLIHVDPRRIRNVQDALMLIPGLEMHQVVENGRIVATVEDTAEHLALDALSEIHKTSGVVAAALVYHSFEPTAANTNAE